MTTNENAITLRFTDRAAAYQALSDLKHLPPAGAEVRGAVLVERLADGTVRVPEGLETDAEQGLAVGGVIGSLVGILGGPLGVLMGWGIGAVIGGGHGYRRAEEATEAVGGFTPHLPPGGTVVLAEVVEHGTEALDVLAMRHDAVLERRPTDSVRAELKAMEDAAERMRGDEVRARRESRRAGAEQRIRTGVAQLKRRIAS
ncbi:hypothetical protein ABZX85_15435 [Streptomyces sp. NPDC004539]|uniref:hypothetical protein n=1 Tax=Streptomyces sp. NPDC004539 TaxID=3154280 RepID=UPI0033AC23DC